MRNEWERGLLGKPSVCVDECAVCGRKATNHHHVIIKGMGGTSPEIEREIPTITLCGMGNASGCHGLAHKHKLHFGFDSRGWVYLYTKEPMPEWECWVNNRSEYRPLPGWIKQQMEANIIGRRS